MAKRKHKRANNEGSIFQRGNGSWRAQVTLDGKRLSYTGKSHRECREWVRDILNQIDEGLTYKATQITVDEFLKDWLIGIKSSIRPKTHEQYEQVARDYLLPYIGEIKVYDLRPDQIQRLYNYHLSVGLGERLVKLAHSVLHRALNQAIELGIITRNPASVAKPPRVKQKEMKFYDEAQVQALLITAVKADDRYLALFKLAVTTGMRQGELLALKWTDVDWRSRTISIQRQLKRRKGGGFRFAEPKTKAGFRAIELGTESVRLLRAHQRRLDQDRHSAGEKWQEYGMVFPSLVGTPTQPTKLIKRFKRLIRLAGLPEIRFHDLRHTAASLMLNHKVAAIVVSRRLGHSKPSITLDIYGHLIPAKEKEVAELMDVLTTPIEINIPA